MSLRLLGGRLAVKRDEVSNTTDTGIQIVGDMSEAYSTGTITHIGPGNYEEGTANRLPMNVEVGERVMFLNANDEVVEVDGQELVVLTEEAIIAIIAE